MNNKSKLPLRYISMLLALLLLIAAATVLLFINQTAAAVVLCASLVYGGVVFFALRRRIRSRIGLESAGIQQMLSSFVCEIDSPVMVVNETNRIIWSNVGFDSLPDVSNHHITSGAGKLFGGAVSYANLSAACGSTGGCIDVETAAGPFSVRAFPLDFGGQRLFGTIWYDRKSVTELQKMLDDGAIRIAYIVIDNTNEVTQEIQENRRFGSATVNKLLTEWANGYNAMLIEYDRDKYVMQFENRFLSDMINSRFDIIDRVVESSLGESPVPITISIGVSAGEGTLLEKRESAQSALRSALQRGGALAVVRTPDGEDSYGGRTKAVQRQTKIRSRLCRDLLFDLIPKSSNVIIMGHQRPDFDSIASNIGISKLVYSFDKPYSIVADVNDSNISGLLATLTGFPEYENVFVDEVYAQELLTPDTLVIITDVSNPELFAARGVYDNASRVVVIDHHAIKETLGEQVVQPSNIDPTASSASELVCEILELSLKPGVLRPEEAQVLLAGILLDTQYFSRDTGTRTYSACSFLRNAGAEAGKAKNFFKSDIAQFRAVTKIEERFEVYKERFAISAYDYGTDPQNKVTASKAADRLIEIDGISASFVLYTLDNGVNLSARSDGSINVINIAKMLGGGGHFQSAGALIRRLDGDSPGVPVFDIGEAEAILKKAIDEYISNS